MRGFKSLLVLVVVLAGLGGYIYFVESKKPEGGAASGDAEGVLGEVRRDRRDVGEGRRRATRTTLKKVNGAWQIVEPLTTAADEAEVSGIVSEPRDRGRHADRRGEPGRPLAVRPRRAADRRRLQDGGRQAVARAADRRQDRDARRSLRQAAEREEGVPDPGVVRVHVQPQHVRPPPEERCSPSSATRSIASRSRPGRARCPSPARAPSGR